MNTADIRELNAAAQATIAASARNGDMQAAADAAMPNIVDLLGRFDTYRMEYKLHRAVLNVLEFPTIRGFARRTKDAEFAAQKALRDAQDGAVCAAYDYDEDEVVGETLNDGELEVAARTADTLPDFPYEVALPSYKALRTIVSTAAANIGGSDKQYYPELRVLPAVAEGVVKYQSVAQKERAAQETAAKTAAAAEVTPAQQKALLNAAQRKLDSAEAFMRKVIGTDKEEEARKSVASAKSRLTRLSGGEDDATAAPATADSVRIAVQDFLNAYKASGKDLLPDEDWLALPIYTQFAIWEAVSDVLALELDRVNRGRLMQLANESDAQYLQRINERDAVQAASAEAAEWVVTFEGHWQVLLDRQRRDGTPEISQQRGGLR